MKEASFLYMQKEVTGYIPLEALICYHVAHLSENNEENGRKVLCFLPTGSDYSLAFLMWG